MFSLIITIVGIALVVALAVSSLYHGGAETFARGQAEAEIAKSLNELNQIRTARGAFYADTGAYPKTLDELVPKYLASIPEGWGVDLPSLTTFDARSLSAPTEEAKLDACNEVNRRIGLTGAPPTCSSISKDFNGCCVAAPAP